MVLSIGDIPHRHGHHVVSIVCIEGSLCGVIYRGYTSLSWSPCCKYRSQFLILVRGDLLILIASFLL